MTRLQFHTLRYVHLALLQAPKRHSSHGIKVEEKKHARLMKAQLVNLVFLALINFMLAI
jgi:hypothetical protein